VGYLCQLLDEARGRKWNLWSCYVSNPREAVAVRSTVNRLKCVLPAYVRTGDIVYPDWRSPEVYSIESEFDEVARVLRKRQYFDFEREFRAFVIAAAPEEAGGKAYPSSSAPPRHRT
jgi:hypothetical protein